MAEKVNIASLTIDVNDVIKKSGELKRQIEDLKKSQKGLDKTTVEGSQAFAKNEATLKNLSKAYRDNQQFASSLESANKDLTKTLSTENKSTQELRDSRRDLNQISKNIIGNSEEEIALREQLNISIDEHTEALRDQSSEFNASKDKIGEYTEGINLSNLSVKDFVAQSKEAGGAGKLVGEGAKAGAKGMLSLIKSTLAFLATPIGVVLAVVAGAFLLIKNAMDRSEESTTKIKKAFAAFTGIIKAVLSALEPLGNFLIDILVESLEFVEKGIFSAMKGIATALEFLGFDEAAKDLRSFTSEVKASAEASRELVQAELDLEKAQRIARKTQLDFQKDAEKLRQIRDDEALSIQERFKANEDLGKLLIEQGKIEQDIANKAIIVADARIKQDGETKEALDQRAAALTELADIQERIVGQESEQLMNLNSLRRESAEQVKKIQEEAIQKQTEELDLFIAQQGTRAKTLEEGLILEREISDKKLKILQDQLDAQAISQTEYNTQVLEIQDDLLNKQSELAIENAARELENYIANNESKLDADRFLTEQAVEEEQRRLDLIAEKKRAFQEEQFALGVINQTELNTAINEINEENRLSNEELEAERKAAKAEQEAIDAENKLIANAEAFQNEFATFQEELQLQRAFELSEAEKTGASKVLINKKFDAVEKNLAKDLTRFKNEQNALVLGGIASLFGGASVLGKAFSIAEIATNTIQNASKAFAQAAVFASNPLTFALAANARIQGGIIIASGAANAAKVAGVKLEKGGILKGLRHSQGGIPLRNGDEGEDGEAVINRRSTGMFAPLLSAINVAGGGRSFANGGILASSAAPSSFIDLDLLATKLGEQFVLLPNPIVSIEEINTVNDNVDVVESDASI